MKPTRILPVLTLLTGCRQIEYRAEQVSEIAHETGWVFYAVLAVALLAVAVGVGAAIVASRSLAWIPIALAVTSVVIGVAGWQMGLSNLEEAVVAFERGPPPDAADDGRFARLVLPGESPEPTLPQIDVDELRAVGTEIASKCIWVGGVGALPGIFLGAVALLRSRRRNQVT